MITSILIILSSAHAAPATSGMQMAVYPGGLDLGADFAAGQQYDIEPVDYSMAFDCFDEVGVEGFNAHIELDSMEMDLGNGQIDVTMRIGEFSGDNIGLYGVDSDWADLCPSFSVDLYYYDMQNMVVEMSLAIEADNGAMVAEVIGAPEISGNLDMDMEWVPDDLVLAFFEETMYTMMADKMVEMVPEMVETYLQDLAYNTDYGNFAFDVSFQDMEITSGAMEMGIDAEMEYFGGTCEAGSAGSLGGTSPNLGLSNGRGSDFGMGVTEAQMNSLFASAWEDGLLCLDDDRIAMLAGMLELELPPQLAEFEIEVGFGGAPHVSMDTDGMLFTMNDFSFSMVGTQGGERLELMSMTATFGAKVEMAIDQGLSAITMTLHEASITVSDIAADPLLSDRAGAADRMVNLIESWVAEGVAGQIDDMAVYASLMHLMDVYIRVDDVSWVKGGMALYTSMFMAGDPEIDMIAPNTTSEIVDVEQSSVSIKMEATDDRGGVLAYSYRLDNGSWSSWSVNDRATLNGVTVGEHTLEVKSRDSWWNEDTSPATVQFVVTPNGGVEGSAVGCGCSTSGSPRLGQFWTLAIAALAFTRRRRPLA